MEMKQVEAETTLATKEREAEAQVVGMERAVAVVEPNPNTWMFLSALSSRIGTTGRPLLQPLGPMLRRGCPCGTLSPPRDQRVPPRSFPHLTIS